MVISCKIYNCCVKKNGFVTCADCRDWPCDKFDGFFEWDSFVTHKVCRPNLERIKAVALREWFKEQGKKRAVLEKLLANYNDGRSRSFYCTATALMPIDLIKEAVNEANKIVADKKVTDSDVKARAKILRSIVQDSALKSGIDLKLRKKPKKEGRQR